jgi:uncharacterized membrane protein
VIPVTRTAEESEETTRLEAFSDGIFAIAMTLLVLEIRLSEDIVPGTLGDALLHVWRSYLAFLTSFATIGVMWVNHHRIFNLIPTAVVARNIRSVNARTAVLFYNGTFAVIAICWGVLWRYAVRNRHLMGKDVDERSMRGVSRQYALGPLYYIVAGGVALVSPVSSVVIDLLLAIFFALPARTFHPQSTSP